MAKSACAAFLPDDDETFAGLQLGRCLSRTDILAF